jgi:hypothetical protein
MPTTDPRVHAYIAQSAEFARPILRHLRRLVHAACPDVVETMKWRFPHFDYRGSLCGMAAFKEHCSFGLWKGELILGRGPGGADGKGMGHFGRIKSLADLPAEQDLLGYLREAVRLNDEGIKKPVVARQGGRPRLTVPDDLAAALERNPKAQTTFHGLSPSHRREYIEWITEAKRPETRQKRLATTLEWLEQGKLRNWKHAKD